MNRFVVVQSEDLNAAPAAWIGERCELVRARLDSGQAFDEALSRADAMVVRTYTCVDSSLLARAPKLKVVGRAGVGLDNIDVRACRARGVEVVHTPDANSQAVVEYVYSLIFDALRPRVFLEAPIDCLRWRSLRTELSAHRQLSSCTLGVLGLGRIGTRVARVGVAMGCRVLYHDLREIAEQDRAGATSVSFDRLLRESDVLTMHVDGRNGNRKLICEESLAKMKRDVVFVNAARGMIVDEGALASFLRANPAACAMLDVHEREPFEASCPLLGLANAHLAPHLAASTDEAHEAMGWVVRDVWRVLSGEKPEWPAQDI